MITGADASVFHTAVALAAAPAAVPAASRELPQGGKLPFLSRPKQTGHVRGVP